MPIEQLMRAGLVRPIVRWGTPILHRPARPVTVFDEALFALLADMFATNRAADGAGLAAPQIGVDLAVFVFDCTDETGARRSGVLCNPTVMAVAPQDRQLVDYDEGCLSLPGANISLARPEFATARGLDQVGDALEITAGDTLGRCLQHETDHLDGLVFGERLSRRARKQLYREHESVAARYPDDWPVSARATP